MAIRTERERLGLYNLKEMASLLGVNYWTLATRLRNKQFPEPTHGLALGRRRYYSRQEATAIIADYKKEGN
jgi:hypothetical protein